MKALINMRNSENYALRVRSVKNSKKRYIARNCWNQRKRFKLHGIVEILLGWRE